MFCAYSLAVQPWYYLGLFGAQKFSYVLHYMRQATLSNPPIHVHGEFERAVTRQLLGFLRGNALALKDQVYIRRPAGMEVNFTAWSVFGNACSLEIRIQGAGSM